MISTSTSTVLRPYNMILVLLRVTTILPVLSCVFVHPHALAQQDPAGACSTACSERAARGRPRTSRLRNLASAKFALQKSKTQKKPGFYPLTVHVKPVSRPCRGHRRNSTCGRWTWYDPRARVRRPCACMRRCSLCRPSPSPERTRTPSVRHKHGECIYVGA